MHEGPVLLAGDALALEPVLLLQTALSVVLRRVEEDWAVVLADLLSLQRWSRSTTQFSPNPVQYITLFKFHHTKNPKSHLEDVLDGLDYHVVLNVVTDNAWITAVKDQNYN